MTGSILVKPTTQHKVKAKPFCAVLFIFSAEVFWTDKLLDNNHSFTI